MLLLLLENDDEDAAAAAAAAAVVAPTVEADSGLTNGADEAAEGELMGGIM